ncbi:hypothetical protein [Mucilaginibacter paludis]|uniref:Uncharacterized protein n=1 Tax=Mucilaginibacter paludis DSM 18603 TaxID=714943 RepID=H1Y4E5_9SPHI|nr:hypothetical protein [Mucilaginibacter paludis]EHQ25779.1 hypothetical protein Mucpa_1622 [Mucilaginibacter paludis DSM 18603]
MAILCLLLPLASPALQIYLSSLRIRNRINISIGIIALLATVLGFVSTAFGTAMIMQMLSNKGIHCGVPAGGFFVLGITLTVAATPVIALIGLHNYRKTRIS